MNTLEFLSKAESMYLDYVNNFITLEGFASHYAISIGLAIELINFGRVVFESSEYERNTDL
jgi:hypothetical protein